MNAIAQRYKAVQVKTCSPGELLVMLYDGLFRFIQEAAASMREDDRARSGERIDRAHAILGELVAGLRHDVAPELCDNLQAVYCFCMGQLVQANIERNPARLDDVLRVLLPLREGFREAVSKAA